MATSHPSQCEASTQWKETDLLPFAYQEAEQTLISELSALARVPLPENKPFSNKRGLPGTSLQQERL